MRGGFGGGGGGSGWSAEPPWAREEDRRYHQAVGDSGRGRRNSTSRGISNDTARGAHSALSMMPAAAAAAAAVDWRGGGGVAPASRTAPWATDYDLPGERQVGASAVRDQRQFTTEIHHQNHREPEHPQTGRDMQIHHQRGGHHKQPPHGGGAWEGERHHHHQQAFDINNHGSAASNVHGYSGQGERHQRGDHDVQQDDGGVGVAQNSDWKRPATMAPSWVRGGGQDLIVPSPSQGRKVQDTHLC
jgi:hypothetical protein